VTEKVNAAYAARVPKVSPASAGPHLAVRMAVTTATSKTVGATLKTIDDSVQLMPRVPLDFGW
jgi:hypothetical protein